MRFFVFPRLIRGTDMKRNPIKKYLIGTDRISELEKHIMRYNNIIEGADIGTWELNVQSGVQTINERWADMLGYTIEELYPITIDTWINNSHPEDIVNVQKELKQLLEKVKEQYDVEFRMKHKDGHWVWLNGRARVNSWTPDGKPLMASGTHTDISERKKCEKALLESEQKYRLITENISDVISIYNYTKDKFTYVSPSIVELRGFTVEEIMKESMEDSLCGESLVAIKEASQKNIAAFIENPKSSQRVVTEVEQPCKNGNTIWVEITSNYQYNSIGEIEVVNVSRNIDERKKMEQLMLNMSYYDQLTGLYNRRFYEEELKRLDSERNLPISLLMADVNGLKLMNDAFGHKAGDLFLKKTANILKSECRSGEIIARIGGDEFVILLPKIDIEEAGKLASRIDAAILNEKVDNAILSISIGCATKHNVSETIDQIFKEAEDDMYRHKLSESSGVRSKTIKLVMNSLFEKNKREMLHSTRVSKLCEAISRNMNFDKEDVDQIRTAGMVHDIGKIAVSENLLHKDGRLDEDEWKEIKRHSETGYRILSSANEFSEIADYILFHHERWDGKGYPKGLKGNKIPVQSRIICVADAFDAMTSERCYRKIFSLAEAAVEIRRCAGTQFDPEIAKIFIEKVLHKPW